MSEPALLSSAAERIVIAAQSVSPQVRLVGGAGLALLLHHRRSQDLDLFCGVRADVEPIVRAVEQAAQEIRAAAARVRLGPGFVRLELALDDDTLRVDVASDTAPRLSEEDTYVGAIRVESLRDQRANKMVALLGRSELRDLVDLYFLERAGFSAAHGFEDAVRKDAGMDPAWFAWALGQIEIRVLGDMLVPLDEAELGRYRDELQQAALDLAGAAS